MDQDGPWSCNLEIYPDFREEKVSEEYTLCTVRFFNRFFIYFNLFKPNPNLFICVHLFIIFDHSSYDCICICDGVERGTCFLDIVLARPDSVTDKINEKSESTACNAFHVWLIYALYPLLSSYKEENVPMYNSSIDFSSMCITRVLIFLVCANGHILNSLTYFDWILLINNSSLSAYTKTIQIRMS